MESQRKFQLGLFDDIGGSTEFTIVLGEDVGTDDVIEEIFDQDRAVSATCFVPVEDSKRYGPIFSQTRRRK